MLRKAQLVHETLIYILIVIAIAATVIFSISKISELNQLEQKTAAVSFAQTLENNLENQKYKSVGSIDKVTLSLPSSATMVCLTEDNEQFSPYSVLQLSSQKEVYKDRNLFLFPVDKFEPLEIKYFSLPEEKNPLCIETKDGKLSLTLTTKEQSTLIEAANDDDTADICTIIPGSSVGDPAKKIDIVFLGFGYDDKKKLSDDVVQYASQLLSIEPFKSNKELFNIWMIDEKQPSCTLERGTYYSCGPINVNRIVASCPNDYVIVLISKKVVGYNIRSSSSGNIAKINTRDNKLVLLHEFGHSFGGLADEYREDSYTWFDAKDFPNCDYAGCEKWKNVNGTDCIKECSLTKFYRSIDISIMRNYDKSNIYGLLNEMIITKNLEEYK